MTLIRDLLMGLMPFLIFQSFLSWRGKRKYARPDGFSLKCEISITVQRIFDFRLAATLLNYSTSKDFLVRNANPFVLYLAESKNQIMMRTAV